MPLTQAQINFIKQMDNKAKKILKYGGQEELLMSLCDKMEAIKKIMDSASEGELNHYCDKFDGFYAYMKLLEQLAQGCANGVFKDVIS